ncbi:hypothetical protein OD750_013655 [Tahibacter sp. BL]|uniref:Uncharacterized protein n=1 Tax=Tahibacter soli TaxID=2983605 RepID=A0A9X3YMR3_9GAMM|nr:hypothetical protein [Tahibacter soli]MDC8013583.1 hypothetical protein [Tahibacter soli]
MRELGDVAARDVVDFFETPADVDEVAFDDDRVDRGGAVGADRDLEVRVERAVALQAQDVGARDARAGLHEVAADEDAAAGLARERAHVPADQLAGAVKALEADVRFDIGQLRRCRAGDEKQRRRRKGAGCRGIVRAPGRARSRRAIALKDIGRLRRKRRSRND